jgi:ankyrin repeat protein
MRNIVLLLILIHNLALTFEKTPEQLLLSGIEIASSTMVKEALEKGACPNMPITMSRFLPPTKTVIKKTYTPLTYLLSVAEHNQKTIETAQELLSKGTTVAADESHQHPLRIALEHKNRTLIDLLLAHSGDAAVDESEEGLALFNAALMMGDTEVIQKVIHSHQVNWQNATPLLVLAIRHNSSQAIDELLTKNIPFTRHFWNSSPLEACVDANNTHYFKKLLEKGAQIAQEEAHGSCLLIKTIRNNNFEMTKLLLDAGVPSAGFDEYAQSQGHTHLANLIRSYQPFN